MIVSVQAMANFLFIPVQPWWSITLILVDLWIIHSLFVHEAAHATADVTAADRFRPAGGTASSNRVDFTERPGPPHRRHARGGRRRRLRRTTGHGRLHLPGDRRRAP